MKKCLSLSILILLLLGACKTDISKKSSNQDYEIISAGSAKEYYFSEVIRNQEDFNNFYRLIFGNKKAPVIDFSKQAVITAFGGSFNTGGYSINVRSIFKKSNKINVNFCMSYPKKNQMVTQAFTNPYIIIALYADPEDEIFIRIEDLR